jgi:hypothetical protein
VTAVDLTPAYVEIGGRRRVKLSRQRGWRKPEGTVTVARPSHWGNFYAVDRNKVYAETKHGRGLQRVGPEIVVVRVDPRGRRRVTDSAEYGGFTDKLDATRFAVDLYRRSLLGSWTGPDGAHFRKWYLDGLAGHDLACWCPLATPDGDPWPCHANVLLEFVNEQWEAAA